MKSRIIFIHGNGGGTGSDNWFPWCAAELQKLGLDVIAPDFPDPILARAEYWLPFLQNELGADENTILVGHSSGAVAAMRYAEQHKLYGSVLVGACYTDLGDDDERKSGYYDKPWDWDAIKANQNWILQYASTDDPYIPIDEAHHIHEKLGTEYYEYTDQGHFGEDKGKKEFTELIEKLKEKLA